MDSRLPIVGHAPCIVYGGKWEALSRPLRHLTLAAESLLPHQKSLMVEAFGVEPRMHYASSEALPMLPRTQWAIDITLMKTML